MITRHLLISGRVQGVFFRESMRQQALQLGVCGWVRNRADGSVEAMIEGEVAAVEALIAWARRGPAEAQVSAMTVSVAETGHYSGFERRPSV